MEDQESELRKKAKDLALIRLSIREYAARELMTYLKRKSIPAEIAEETVKALVAEHLLDDRRYARALTRTQLVRDKGPRYIHAKLRQKGVRIELNEVRDLYAENADRSELETARALVERRYPRAKQDERELKRAFSGLLRRGFSSEIARKVLSEKGVTLPEPETPFEPNY